MNITIEKISMLRKHTQAGIMDCKKALTKAKGDFEKAVDILRKEGEKISLALSSRMTKEGKVFATLNPENTIGIIFALCCETEPVAKNELLISLGENILELALKKQPVNTDELQKLSIEGKIIPEHIIELTTKVGEKISLIDYTLFRADLITFYIHINNKIGVLLAIEGKGSDNQIKEITDYIAMQIAAMNPIAISPTDIPEVVLQKEREIAYAQLRNQGKSEAIWEKITQGKIKNFIKEHSLLSQAFIKNNKITVEKYLKDCLPGRNIKAFKRIAI